MQRAAEKSLFKSLGDVVTEVSSIQSGTPYIDQMKKLINESGCGNYSILIKTNKKKSRFRVVYCGGLMAKNYQFDFTGYEFSDIKDQFQGTNRWSSIRHCLKAYADAAKTGSPNLSRNEVEVENAGVLRFSRLVLPVKIDGSVPYLVAAFVFDS